ncbi:MAG: DUF6512 family protein [Clostridiales bacterium]|nr:DUF6512 family protein [Clostridiales bacterium]
MQKRLMKLEIIGIFFVAAGSVFLQNLYSLSGHTLIGVMFGSVNDSIWEIAKTLMLPYFIWSMLELLCVCPAFHRFAVVKVISLYLLGILFILLCLIFSLFGSSYSLFEFTAALVCICLTFFSSYKMQLSARKFENIFYPAFFMFLLFVALLCSFTPFPPQLYIFEDRVTGLYGIIPENIDSGAVALDALYNMNG